jgi:CRP-like cAMP-binding protein
MAQSPNQLLASLSANTFDAIRPHLEAVEFTLADVLGEPGGDVQRVYFPHSGVISLVVDLSIGDMIETAMVGRDGVLNASSALDGGVSFNKAIVQLAGAGSFIAVDKLRGIADEHKAFRSLLIRHDQVLFAQSQQSAACNASHSVESRMCRWLLRMRDLAGWDELTLTQEFLAQMLGVRRTSVSVIASTLQKAGFIRYRRGNIQLLDIEGLQDGACECYGTVKAHYERLLSSH